MPVDAPGVATDRHRLIRMVTGIRGSMTLEARVEPRFDYGRSAHKAHVTDVGPIAGALIAVGFAMVLRGRGGDVISRATGSGVLDERALTAKAQLSEDIERGKVVPQGIADTHT